MIATVLVVVSILVPSPDPHPSACHQGWCLVPTTRAAAWTEPLRLPGRKGWWVCKVTKKKLMRCIQLPEGDQA